MNTTEIIEAIENGQQKEKWDEWLNHESEHVRYRLAYQEYNLEHFIDDDHKTIREMVMEKQPNLIPEIIRKHPEDIYTAERIIANNENATLENLKYIYNSKATDATPLKIRAYDLKIQSLETKPTLLESTMSISELFTTKNALWAKPYNVTQIYQIQRYYEQACKINAETLVLENFEQIFNPTYDPYNMYKNFHDIVES